MMLVNHKSGKVILVIVFLAELLLLYCHSPYGTIDSFFMCFLSCGGHSFSPGFDIVYPSCFPSPWPGPPLDLSLPPPSSGPSSLRLVFSSSGHIIFIDNFLFFSCASSPSFGVTPIFAVSTDFFSFLSISLHV